MTHFLDEAEYRQLQQQIAQGETRISIPRSVARQFFLRVDNKSISSTTNKSALKEKMVVWLGTLTAPLLFCVCAALIIMKAGLGAALAVPLAGVIWTVLAGFTSETGDWHSVTGALAVTLIFYVYAGHMYALALLIFTLSLWIHRMTFIVAEYFLSQIVISSFAAYDMLVDHVQLESRAD